MIDVKVQSSIKEYERAIGNAEMVIVVLSDNYFESPDCMYEMAKITNRDEINERVIFVSHFKSVKRNKKSYELILNNWKDKYNAYRDIDPLDSALTMEMNYIAEIIQALPKFWKHVLDDVAIPSENVEKDSAASITSRILDLINQRQFTQKTPTISPVSNPVNSGNTPSILVSQTGQGSAAFGIVNGDVFIGGKNS